MSGNKKKYIKNVAFHFGKLSQGTVKEVSSVGKLTICCRNIKRDEKLVYFGATFEHIFEKF